MVDAARLAILALVLAGLSACGVAGVEAPPEIAVDEFDPGPRVRHSPNVTIAPNGKATCTWIGDGNVYAERFLPGFGWTPSRQISDDVGSAENPLAATDRDGNAVVIWEQEGVIVGNTFEVGTGWTGPAVVSRPQTPAATRPQVAMNDGGDAMVVWEQDGRVLARPFDDAEGWRPEVALDASPAGAGDASVEIAATGDVLVAWERHDGTVLARRFDASRAAWDDIQDLGAGANPDVGVDDRGNGVVAFEDRGEILVSEYTADVAWTAPQVVSLPAGTPPGQAHTPDVAVSSGGEALISFCVGAPEAGEVFVAERSPGEGVAAATSIAPDVPSCGPPVAALDAEGNAVVLFQDTHDVVQAVPHNDITETWSQPIVLGEGRDPSLAGNDGGDAVTVFVTDGGIGGRVIEDLDAIPAAVLGVVVQGGGTVVSEPAAIVCTGGLCEQAFIEEVHVTLTATPLPGHRFSHWVGVGTNPTDPTTGFFVTTDAVIEAHFVPAP